jgi:hypothetical protein
MKPIPSPPWRWRAFAAVTAPAGLDDARARELWSARLLELDALDPAEIAAALDTSARTIFRARAWVLEHDPALWAKLRPRVGGLGYEPPRGARA